MTIKKSQNLRFAEELQKANRGVHAKHSKILLAFIKKYVEKDRQIELISLIQQWGGSAIGKWIIDNGVEEAKMWRRIAGVRN